MGQLKYPAGSQPVFSTSVDQKHPLGARGEDIFGRTFRYCLVGAVDLVVGNAIQAAAQQANHQQRTPVAAAIDDDLIDISIGATAITARDYEAGMAVIDTTPGVGYSYPIRTDPGALSSAASVQFTLAAGWDIEIALTTTSRVSLYANPYSRVIQTPVTTLTNVCVGVALMLLDDADYGWLGTHGCFSTLIDGTPAVANSVSVPAAVAGGVAINSGTLQIVGTMMDTGVDTLNQGVFWTVD